MTTAAVQAVVDVGGAPVGRLMDRVELRMAELATGHGPVLARYAGETIAAGGKRLRPLLVCIAAGAPPPETDGLVRAAVSVELVHGATLVHDDVLDGCAAGARPSLPPAAATLLPRRATCCSRGRLPSLPRVGHWRRCASCRERLRSSPRAN
jgi:hypothetical protein